jgi:putative FmdB family regulatory protein
MPTYSYQCEECGHSLEAVQRMSDDPLTDCPACKTPRLVRRIQAVGFALKGTGWYVTDFRDKGKKAATASETSKAEPAADTKPAAAAAPEAKTEPAKPAAPSSD